jgi:hypothetical protein
MSNRYSKRVLEIAALLEVPKAVVDHVRRIKKERPDLLEQIQAGYLSIDGAIRIIQDARDTIIFPIRDLKEAAFRIAKLYGEGSFFLEDIEEFFRYLQVEIENVDKRHEQQCRELVSHLKLVPKSSNS